MIGGQKGIKLTKSEYDCSTNEIKLKQELTKHFFYNNMPAKFNRVCGEDVNIEIAIQCLCLNHMVELHMSESEADEFLLSFDGWILLYHLKLASFSHADSIVNTVKSFSRKS